MLALAGQRLAESHALGGQGGRVLSTHFWRLLLNLENRLEHELRRNVASSVVLTELEKKHKELEIVNEDLEKG